MHTHRKSLSAIEPLEARIAPATLYPTIADAERDPSGGHFKTTTVGTPILLTAGDVFSTGGTPQSGSYLMFVEKGHALIFTTDLNQNGSIDFNEITGISAGDGLRLISFVDIHGDIVTNLRSNDTLTDSDNNNANDNLGLKGDGRVLLNSRIEKIELRSLQASDIIDQNGDGAVDDNDLGLRLVMSSYSIFGQILAGGGFGVKSDSTSGLIIDDRGKALQQTFFPGPRVGSPFGPDYYDPGVTPIKSMVGGIVVGSAASGEYFSFGIARNTINDPLGNGTHGDLANGNDVQGTLKTFIPTAGTVGAGIFHVTPATQTVMFNIGRLIAGDGGIRAAGGNIENVTLNGDNAGGYVVLAGNGGSGAVGGAGGSVLNFEDLNSNTSQLVVRGGTGGDGSTGAGGAGGIVTFGTMNVLGNILIKEGDGGTGFTSGGSGASLSKAVISAPDRLEDYARNIVGTTHDTPHDPITGRRIIVDPLAPGVIGQGTTVDFDGDGFGDIVFTSTDPSQLVVQFGNGAGGFRLAADGTPDRIYLDGPIDAEALTLGDFDGDGHYDVAAASSAGGNHAGIMVFLSKYEDINGDGVLSASEDLDGDGFNDLVDFRAPRYSPLPNVDGLTRSGHAIADIEAGDFDGDGFTDLAVVATYFTGTNGLQPAQFLLFMYSDVEDGKPTGQFLADFGTKGQAIPPIPANPLTPIVRISGNDDVTANIEVTALSRFADHDVVVALADNGARARTLQIFDNSNPSLGGPTPLGPIPLGRVDQNRDLPNGGNQNLQLANATGMDFAVLDFNQDGTADFSVILEAPAGFLITLAGDGLGGASRIDNVTALNGNQNSGFFFGPPANGNGGVNITTNLRAIIATDADGDGIRDEVAILYTAGTLPTTFVIEMEIGYPPDPVLDPPPAPPTPPQYTFPVVGSTDNPGAAISQIFVISSADDQSIVAIDAFNPVIGDPRYNYAVGETETGQFVQQLGRNFIISVGNLGGGFVFNAEHNLLIVAGNGGTGIIGRGGDGGSIGSGTIDRATAIGNVDIRIDFGRLQLIAGNGGNGFSGGGRGGSVVGTTFASFSGTALQNLLDAQLFGGNGGLAVSGAGGAGGSLSGNSILFGFFWQAGNGGSGIVGGGGGSIVGNGINGLYDTATLGQVLIAGAGGNGVRRGGDGGGIRNFHSSLDINSSIEGGSLLYAGGAGGSAVSGPGGNGGSVVNVSPLTEDRNQLAGDIYMVGGRGGDGRSGGNGGSVDTFKNATDQFQVPALLSFLGGDGGNGTKGNAGHGGSVKNISTASTGSPNVLGSISLFQYDRVIAGRGGNSAGGNGGNGGGVSAINVTAQDNPLVLVGGAGGDGLFRGGNGGSVTSSTIQIGNSSFAKGVIIAGEGGDANAYLGNANDPLGLKTAVKSFGGKIGRGGDGGGISGIKQLGGVLTRLDLIAGNGGDTINYGTVVDISNFAGKGGSITNIKADGDIGNVAANVPIRSYNDIRTGETMDDFVRTNLRNEANPGSVADTVGNVGLVAGAAGRIKAIFNGYSDTNETTFPSLPANKGVNGSVINVTARNIMSAVAGNVERIAAIQSVKDIRLTSGGDLGADKISGIAGDPSFLDAEGDASLNPVLDGILIDGALVARSRPVTSAGKPIALGPNVYILA